MREAGAGALGFVQQFVNSASSTKDDEDLDLGPEALRGW